MQRKAETERRLSSAVPALIRLTRCSYYGCLGPLPEKKALLCTKCRAVVYCSSRCAAAAWTGEPPVALISSTTFRPLRYPGPLKPTDELVAYGMADELAPALMTSRALHVEADEYHELMTQPNSVIIDVRNAYESAIGHFQPPPGGAELIDPKLRNSIEFPKWLNAPETQQWRPRRKPNRHGAHKKTWHE